jgi:hypothetical protein
VIALASGVPLLMAVAMLVAGTVGVVLDARRHERRTGE